MITVDLVLTIFAGGLALSALPTVYRIIAGPTILDRAVATDMFVVLVVLGMALYSASTGTSWAITSMLALTAFAFIGTVAVTRFVAREERRPGSPRGMGASSPQRDPASEDSGRSRETSAHSAIDLRPADRPEGTSEEERPASEASARPARTTTWFPEDDWSQTPSNDHHPDPDQEADR